MQTQQISPYAEATAAGEQPGYGGMKEQEHMALGDADDHAQKKKSVLGKVKEKAKKLKTKIKKPKSPGSTENHDGTSSSSSEEEGGNEPHDQQRKDQLGEETEVVIMPGPKGESYEAIPDDRITIMNAHGPNVEERFGQLNIGGDDEPETGRLQEDIPSAPGHASAGVTPYQLATRDIHESHFSPGDQPLELGKDAAGHDLSGTPAAPHTDFQGTTPLRSDKPDDISRTGDNSAAWYMPTSRENLTGSNGVPLEEKPLKDRVNESATAVKGSATSAGEMGASALGLKSDANTCSKEVESGDCHVTGGKKSMLEQAKEKIFGSSKQLEDEPRTMAGERGESKPITSRAVETVSGFKDGLASKLGYGAPKSQASEGTLQEEPVAMQTDAERPENTKPILEKLQEKVAGATTVVTSKLGYGDDKQHEAAREKVGADDNKPVQSDTKSYTQKAYDAAQGAKEALASKLGYGAPKDGSSTEMLPSGGEQKSYLQKMQETAVGAKDAVATKLGYGSGHVPASSESAYGHENMPASTAECFHPGEEDRALAQLITEKMSTGAATVKDTLLRPFASKSGPPTPTTTPTPSSAAAVAADPAHTTLESGDAALSHVKGDNQPSIIGKVTGAVSSLLGSPISGKNHPDEAAGKAEEDPQVQTAGVCNAEMHEAGKRF